MCFFRDQVVIHQTTILFTPQQNGVSEPKNRQIIEVAHSLMLVKCIPNHLSGHAILAAVYLINIFLSRVLDFQTPLSVLKNMSLLSLYSNFLLSVWVCGVCVFLLSSAE